MPKQGEWAKRGINCIKPHTLDRICVECGASFTVDFRRGNSKYCEACGTSKPWRKKNKPHNGD